MITPEQQKIPELEARLKRHELEKEFLKKGYGYLGHGRVHTNALIDQLRERAPITEACVQRFRRPHPRYDFCLAQMAGD